LPEYEVTMVPPEGQPQTFKDTNDADGTEIERPMIRIYKLNAGSENAARVVCERSAFDIATQEVAASGDFTDEQQDEQMDAVLNNQWVIQSIETTGSEKAAAPAAETAPAE
jgi:hypothetical protein